MDERDKITFGFAVEETLATIVCSEDSFLEILQKLLQYVYYPLVIDPEDERLRRDQRYRRAWFAVCLPVLDLRCALDMSDALFIGQHLGVLKWHDNLLIGNTPHYTPPREEISEQLIRTVLLCRIRWKQEYLKKCHRDLGEVGGSLSWYLGGCYESADMNNL